MRAFGVRTSTARGARGARAGGKHQPIVVCEPTSNVSLQLTGGLRRAASRRVDYNSARS